MMTAIGALRAGDAGLLRMLAAQKAYADFHYGWDRRMALWLGSPYGAVGAIFAEHRRHRAGRVKEAARGWLGE